MQKYLRDRDQVLTQGYSDVIGLIAGLELLKEQLTLDRADILKLLGIQLLGELSLIEKLLAVSLDLKEGLKKAVKVGGFDN